MIYTIIITGCSEGVSYIHLLKVCSTINVLAIVYQGLGYELAVAGRKYGHKVFATARSIKKMQGLTELGCICLPLDVTDQASVDSLKENVLKALGPEDFLVLINNAAVHTQKPTLE